MRGTFEDLTKQKQSSTIWDSFTRETLKRKRETENEDLDCILDGPDECGETGNLIFDFQARDFHFLKSLEEISLIHISPHNVN